MAARIALTGDCTVGRAEELRATLLQVLDAGEDVEIDLAGVTAIDLAFCQLLHALRLSCQTRGVEMRVRRHLPEGVAGHAAFCGFPELAEPGTPVPVRPQDAAS